MGFPGGSVVSDLAANAGGAGSSLSWEDHPHPEKEMATTPRILAWEIPLTVETGQLQFTGSQKSN